MIDLGSANALMLSSAYIEAQALTKGRTTSTAALGGIEGVTTADAFMTPRLSIGGHSIENIPTLGNRSWISTSTVGNIGIPVIGQFDVVFDVTAGCVWFRSSPAEGRLPMLKDRSGLGLSASGHALTVVHVATGSPAAKAGWLVDERIIAVNDGVVGPDYTHGSLWHWRFDPAGTLVTLRMDGGSTREITLADYY